MALNAARIALAAKALDTKTRVNGGAVMTRRALVEKCVNEGYRVAVHKREGRVLMAPDGSWFDAKAITKAAIDYAETLY
jgi:hypothetical protein